MADQPMVAELLAQIQALQNQVNLLAAAAAVPTPAATAPVIFADTPQTLEVENWIDYGTKRELRYSNKDVPHSMTSHLLMAST
jgi:hypothetical protein